MKPNHSSMRPPGVLLAVLAVSLAGCEPGSDPMGVHSGGVRFTLSAGEAPLAAPAPTSPAETGWDGPLFQSANVTLSSILARNLNGVLLDVEMDLPVTVDIVAMEEGGRTVTLPDGELPPGMYDQVVVVATAVQGVLRDGTTVTIEPPGGGWTAIVPVCPFEVAEGETAVVGLVLPVRHALVWRDGRFRFVPRFRSLVECGDEQDDGDDGDGGDGGDDEI